MMLDVALKFEKAFARYEEEDDKFVSFFMENEHGGKRIGPPTSSDWEIVTIFVKFLSTFYEVTLKFSGTLHVTSNNFYHEICEIHTQLSDLACSSDPLLSTMAASMKRKYDKYWGSAENINPMLFFAVVLDPRYKLKYCFETVYDVEIVAKIVVKVERILQRLYNSYNVEGESDGDKVSKSDSPPKGGVKETIRRRLLENYLQQQQMFVTEKMNDVDKYLAEETINPMTSSFDILLWWKDNSQRFKILSMIAKDVLAIPVSTVASESAFSTSGCILDSFRSSLSPKMVEALVCTQNWLKGSHEGIQTREYLDDIQAYEFLEEDNKLKDKATTKEKTNAPIAIVH
ncbi:zinc finger BED domain-containing protein RICESLEEPER 2-like [Humulus lupulus]|uniref:zinc finger BED domain-containing protein RICESLEEPER 2-like n=1 Tax=Humulus lupulus TaxID=3486 RepID=UPI002B409B69|nr:zinc finger BED domain-containing protein RICESLEEPER 2-like [Humulus lupulus]